MHNGEEYPTRVENSVNIANMPGGVEIKMKSMFYPRSVAVVGASSHPGKTGNFVLRSAIGSRVEKVYPVNASGVGEILGKKSYRTIEDIPDNSIDLFLFAVPQQHILSGLRSAIDKGCRAAVIYSSGFKEAGPEGERMQEELRDLADKAGVRIIGPNTMGFFRADSFINGTFNPVYSDIFREPGKIAIVSQSGGVAGFIINQFIDQQLPPGTVVCLGNRVNVEFADMLDYFAYDSHTSMVLLFIEGIDDLRRFYHSAKSCAARKPVIVLGAGYTEGGRRVARSHTGSMAGSGAIYRAVFRQAGLLQVNSVEELVDAAKIITMSPPPRGNRVAMITHTAGPAILASDVLENGGMQLARLSDATKRSLTGNNVLPSFMPPDNPVDLATFGFLEHDRYIRALSILAEDDGVDSTLTICMSPMGDENMSSFPVSRFKEVSEQSGKPAVFAWAAPISREEEFRQWTRAGVPAYPTTERGAAAMVNLMRYHQLRQGDAGTDALNGFSGFGGELEQYVAGEAAAGKAFMPEHKAKDMLALAGIEVAGAVLAANEDEAVETAGSIGYPVALKVVADRVIHKSEVGGVRLNLKDADEVKRAFRQITDSTLAQVPDAGLMGVAVQPMVPGGIEVIVGAIRDEQAGPVVMCGLGGIWVEALRDVAFRLAPVTGGEAASMIRELKGYRVLQGIRGGKAVDIDILAGLIVKVGYLISQFPIKEIDLNPVIFHGSGYAVADARVILSL